VKKAMKRRDRESGQSLVEFALVVPLLFLLLFGSIEFGRVFHAYHVITSAAREGARAAAVGKSNTDIELKIEGAVSSLVSNPANVELKDKATYDSNNPPEGEIYFTIVPYLLSDRTGNIQVEVQVKGALKIIVPLIKDFLGDLKIVKTTAQMRLE
jgi:Flp pilus assembly protein TadG